MSYFSGLTKAQADSLYCPASYTSVVTGSAVTVNSTTPVLIFSSNSSTRIAWRVNVPTTVATGVGMLFKVVAHAAPAPTKAAIVLAPSIRAEASALVVDDASGNVDIYAVMESGSSVTISGEELLK